MDVILDVMEESWSFRSTSSRLYLYFPALPPLSSRACDFHQPAKQPRPRSLTCASGPSTRPFPHAQTPKFPSHLIIPRKWHLGRAVTAPPRLIPPSASTLSPRTPLTLHGHKDHNTTRLRIRRLPPPEEEGNKRWRWGQCMII